MKNKDEEIKAKSGHRWIVKIGKKYKGDKVINKKRFCTKLLPTIKEAEEMLEELVCNG